MPPALKLFTQRTPVAHPRGSHHSLQVQGLYQSQEVLLTLQPHFPGTGEAGVEPVHNWRPLMPLHGLSMSPVSHHPMLAPGPTVSSTHRKS